MNRRPLAALLLFAVLTVGARGGQRINQEGRILGPAPVVTAPTLFDTAAADAIVSAMQILPLDNPWNEDVSHLLPLTNSGAMITQIKADLKSNRQTLQAFYEMNYVLVPDNQTNIPITFELYGDESDPSPYPIPSSMPVEMWPVGTGNYTLQQWQQTDDGSDRHSIIVMPGAGYIWETWETLLVSGAWQASNGAKFNLKSNALRPDTWTSGDAAGLPMFPALVRYDECQRGMVEHAVRLVVAKSRAQHLYPATHNTNSVPASSVNYPAMGQRIRLQNGFNIPTNWTIYEKAVCLALKKYGGLVADNGGFFSFSVCPDDRFPSGAFSHLTSIDISNFEVVQSTGATGGPRSPGAPTAVAGKDQFIVLPTSSVSLQGAVTGTNPTIQWTAYSGPGVVTFGNAALPSTTASFSAPGTYILMLSAADTVHAVARDAVTVTVTLPVSLNRSGNDIFVSFPTITGHTYTVSRATDLVLANWATLGSSIAGTGSVAQVKDTNAIATAKAYYRVAVSP